MTRRKTIRELADGVCEKLRDIGYAEKSIEGYRACLNKYARYGDEKGVAYHSEALADGFVGSRDWGSDRARRGAARACRVIGHFEATGDIPARRHGRRPTPPEDLAAYLELYLCDCAERGLSATTIRERNDDVCQFLRHVEASGAAFPEGVDARLLDAWAADRLAETPGNAHRCLSSVRCFLGHLFSVGVTGADLSGLVPGGGRVPRRSRPKIWTEDEVGALIGSIPSSDSVGKRDRAVCLLLATYGMRDSDVRGLRLDSLDFDACTITFRQSKTGRENVLPMSGAVWEALADWIAHGRPEHAPCPEVFTSMKAPFGRLSSVYDIVARRAAAAGIAAKAGTHAGPHSLRHTVATRQVAAGAPLPVVASVMGQSSRETTMIYVHSDMDALRRCALGEGVV